MKYIVRKRFLSVGKAYAVGDIFDNDTMPRNRVNQMIRLGMLVPVPATVPATVLTRTKKVRVKKAA